LINESSIAYHINDKLDKMPRTLQVNTLLFCIFTADGASKNCKEGCSFFLTISTILRN